jgi:hypothetical protein
MEAVRTPTQHQDGLGAVPLEACRRSPPQTPPSPSEEKGADGRRRRWPLRESALDVLTEGERYGAVERMQCIVDRREDRALLWMAVVER